MDSGFPTGDPQKGQDFHADASSLPQFKHVVFFDSVTWGSVTDSDAGASAPQYGHECHSEAIFSPHFGQRMFLPFSLS
jgi:hypothetical protein